MRSGLGKRRRKRRRKRGHLKKKESAAVLWVGRKEVLWGSKVHGGRRKNTHRKTTRRECVRVSKRE